MKRQYSIMIAVGAPKDAGLYEVWCESLAARSAEWPVHCGYFKTRPDAQAWIDRRIENDCPSNSRQAPGTERDTSAYGGQA